MSLVAGGLFFDPLLQRLNCGIEYSQPVVEQSMDLVGLLSTEAGSKVGAFSSYCRHIKLFPSSKTNRQGLPKCPPDCPSRDWPQPFFPHTWQALYYCH
jgi:hypothetical protein